MGDVKTCVKCGQPGLFQKSKNQRGAMYESGTCRACKAAYRREWRSKLNKKAKKKINAYMRTYRRTYCKRSPEKIAGTKAWSRLNPEKYLFNKMQRRARDGGPALYLTFAEFVQEIGGSIPTVCPILGIEIKIGEGRLLHEMDDSPSVDRLDPSKPYQRGNIAVISLRANIVKRDGTSDEHRKIAEWMGRREAAHRV